jgi:hypothetical protein
MKKATSTKAAPLGSLYETPRLTTYGDLKRITKGQLATSGDTTGNMKP